MYYNSEANRVIVTLSIYYIYSNDVPLTDIVE